MFNPRLLVFRLEKQSNLPVRLDLCAVPAVVNRWREALVSKLSDMPDPVREIVSGHETCGRPLRRPHLAFLPIASVGHRHADGRLLGLAAVVPADLDVACRRDVMQVLLRVEALRLGSLGAWRLIPGAPDPAVFDLRPETWTAYPEGSSSWASVTPVVFDRHPKQKDPDAYRHEAADMIRAACCAVGLPQPREVVLVPISPHAGVPPAHRFPRLRRKDGGERRHTHVILLFHRPVQGPVLIGAGRYRGYGVCRPVECEILK